MNSIPVNWNDLPELTFELILSYLSLEDRIKARAVSRMWYYVINSFRVKRLTFSVIPLDRLFEKNRLVRSVFAQNFINSPRFLSFFQTFGQSIFFRLKELRLFKLDLNTEDLPLFAQTVNSFDQLEELGVFNVFPTSKLDKNFQLRLNLPMLKSVELVDTNNIGNLTLDAPRLKKVKLLAFQKVELVHGESVEKLMIDELERMQMDNLKNLKYLYCGPHSGIIDSTLLSTLEQLKEIHLNSVRNTVLFFNQKERYGLLNLKIFLFGCLLNGPSDPAIGPLHYSTGGCWRFLMENRWIYWMPLTEEIPLFYIVRYSTIDNIDSEQEIDFFKKFTDLEFIVVEESVRDVDRFLELLKNLNHIVKLGFECDQPQEMFDRLPDHCAIRWLKINYAPANLSFLFKLTSLLHLILWFPVKIKFVRKVLESLPFISYFYFKYLHKAFAIEIDHLNQFVIWFGRVKIMVSDASEALQLIREIAQQDDIFSEILV